MIREEVVKPSPQFEERAVYVNETGACRVIERIMIFDTCYFVDDFGNTGCATLEELNAWGKVYGKFLEDTQILHTAPANEKTIVVAYKDKIAVASSLWQVLQPVAVEVPLSADAAAKLAKSISDALAKCIDMAVYSLLPREVIEKSIEENGKIKFDSVGIHFSEVIRGNLQTYTLSHKNRRVVITVTYFTRDAVISKTPVQENVNGVWQNIKI